MGKRIKSVKLKEDFSINDTTLKTLVGEFPQFFEVEYENEYFELSNPYTYIYQNKTEQLKTYCNALRKHCEDTNSDKETEGSIYCMCIEYGKFRTIYFSSNAYFYGLKFSSKKSASQFLNECKPEMLKQLEELYKNNDLV